MSIYDEFEEWLDLVLEKDLPQDIIAFNFNLYDSEETFDIQLIGSNEFDDESDDWACNETYSSEEVICYIEKNDDISDADDAIKIFKDCALKYIQNGKFNDKLNKAKALYIGFIDGDLEKIFLK